MCADCTDAFMKCFLYQVIAYTVCYRASIRGDLFEWCIVFLNVKNVNNELWSSVLPQLPDAVCALGDEINAARDLTSVNQTAS